MTWYITIKQANNPSPYSYEQLNHLFASNQYFEQIDISTYKSIKGMPSILITFATANKDGCHNSNTLKTDNINTIEFICYDELNSAWCKDQAVQIGRKLKWLVEIEHESATLYKP